MERSKAIAPENSDLEPVAQPVAWMMKWPNHSPSFTIDKSDYVSWFAGKASYPEELVPLYSAPTSAQVLSDAMDAKRYRWMKAHGYYAHADDEASIDASIFGNPAESK